MLYINGTEVQLTRGDTAYLKIPLRLKLYDDNGEPYYEPYEMKPEDTLTLTVKKSTKDTVVCFQKETKGSNVFHIKPEDTCDCEFNKYTYDVEIHTNGDTFTVIEPSCFKILPEVTC